MTARPRKQVRPHTEADYASRPFGLVEKPGMYPGEPEAWVYCDKFSYEERETVSLKTHTTADTYDIEVIRDGHRPRTVFLQTGLPGRKCSTSPDAYAVGCGWPEALQIHLEVGKWELAFYLVVISIREFHGRVYEREGFFVVKDRARSTPFSLSSSAALAADFVLIHATSTLLAYNDWGGANHYRGIPDGYQDDKASPLSSTQRPIARGMLRLPQNAPREANGTMKVKMGDLPRFPNLEYAWYFRYPRFGGNYIWQERFDEAPETQYCFRVPQADPETDKNPSRVTTFWDCSMVGRPGAQTVGLTGIMGCYTRYGMGSPRSSGGFQVYHWALAGTSLRYGDSCGTDLINIAGLEVDGVDY
ncbi:hypothetical protein BJY01DRAFT_246499 [Aspergillus pseudoustus]|uniref:N,N-dimethylformamidase beta subunit-like C-terminal domain-containing protein n=1 Tax=Aspergillus pseudoustus TaxID=1810923 RepID=A0ABR4K8T1_9EURO